MADLQQQTGDAAEGRKAAEAFLTADLTCPFGPSFFLGDLGRFVRDRCPDPKENLPLVEIRLADGETLDVCHIIGVAPQWVMLAVRDPGSQHDGMAVELVPYPMIRHVRVGTRRASGSTIGFSQVRPPEVLSPETLVGAARRP